MINFRINILASTIFFLLLGLEINELFSLAYTLMYFRFS